MLGRTGPSRLSASTTGEDRDTATFVDEIPAAYEDVDQVMIDAADLVEVGHTLHQLINVKGDRAG
jgi:tRNA-splicing ligase RtcB